LFALTVLAYPLALALLCVGAGLLIDRCCGGFLPAALLPGVGAAALIALSQLSTYVHPLAPATPYLMLAVALVGFVLARVRALEIVRIGRARLGLLLVPVLAYALALAPVLLAGRATFSSFMALSDSAVHLIGADFLIHHGQSYAHLDLRNSYGQFINDYYATGYPSGADTLFGGSALLLGLPLIWAFQPFNALMLAFASGPAWLLARALGLRGGWAAAAALSATLPALVYGYELVGSVKEITALAMILTLGALVLLHRRWLARSPLRAVPIAFVLGAGVSALGVGFGAWALAAAAVLLVVLVGDVRAGRAAPAAALASIGAGALVLLVAAWPTWAHVSASLHVAQNIASTGNAGNLPAPLRWTQVFGVWLRGSYKQPPAGAWQALTVALIVVTVGACALGAIALLRARRFALAAWIALMLIAWIALSRSATTWVDAKALVLTSSIVVLLAWGGVAALLGPGSRRARATRSRRDARSPRTTRRAPRLRPLAALLALALAGGVLASDVAQYHSSNLAPTARYEELASINERFAGRGPVLFDDFDEYSMYVLRDLDVGGPDFVYPPPAQAALAGGYGLPVRLDRARPASLAAYPLIVTRHDPSASPPPTAYRVAFQGAYYEVWSRRVGAVPALLHAASANGAPLPCARVRRAAGIARIHGLALVGALEPELVHVGLARASRPRDWGREGAGFAMKRPGTLTARFSAPRTGRWQLWLQGQFMASVAVAIDGRPLGSISGQLAGNSLVPDTAVPIAVRLQAGVHRLSVTRSGFSPAPGNGGAAVLDGAFLAPAGTPARSLRRLPTADAAAVLCARRYAWVEVVSPSSAASRANTKINE
jgi:hypothetical protein